MRCAASARPRRSSFFDPKTAPGVVAAGLSNSVGVMVEVSAACDQSGNESRGDARPLDAVMLALLALFCIGWTLRMGILEWATRNRQDVALRIHLLTRGRRSHA